MAKKIAKKKKAVKKKTASKKKAVKKTSSKKPKRLYRANEKDSMIAGVCAGIAEYFNVDPVMIRIIAILLALIDGVGILAYLLAWIIIPRR